MVIVGKKKKKKSAEDVVPEELVEQATRLSKSKRKKLEHIAVRCFYCCTVYCRWMLLQWGTC
jgi:hypothetical protein